MFSDFIKHSVREKFYFCVYFLIIEEMLQPRRKSAILLLFVLVLVNCEGKKIRIGPQIGPCGTPDSLTLTTLTFKKLLGAA